MSFIYRHKRQPTNKNIYKTSKTYKYNFKNIGSDHRITTPSRSNKRYQKNEAKESIFAFNVEQEILAKNHPPTHDLERGWIFDSGVSTHMAPFRKYCRDIQTVHRKKY